MSTSYMVPWADYKDYISRVVIEEGISSVGEWAFANCNNLTSVTLPETITEIDGHAFYCDESLSSINIPDSVTSIGSYAFGGCSKAEGLRLPAGSPPSAAAHSSTVIP